MWIPKGDVENSGAPSWPSRSYRLTSWNPRAINCLILRLKHDINTLNQLKVQ